MALLTLQDTTFGSIVASNLIINFIETTLSHPPITPIPTYAFHVACEESLPQVQPTTATRDSWTLWVLYKIEIQWRENWLRSISRFGVPKVGI